MAGQNFAIQGDAAKAMKVTEATLQGLGFVVTPIDEWAARAERGSKAASLVLGAFAGKKGRHMVLTFSCAAQQDGSTRILFNQETSGLSGGLIGKNQSDKIYSEMYHAVYAALKTEGLLAS